jgi:hypothetical protein
MYLLGFDSEQCCQYLSSANVYLAENDVVIMVSVLD